MTSGSFTSKGEGRVEIDHVSIRFTSRKGDYLALAETALTLEPGTFTALIGPSGCGKSTLLNALAGFVEPTGGMKQRVGIARTLAYEPKVLLMDEPFGALDAQTRRVMHELLLRVWEKHRATVLFVTHDVDEALLLADHVHVMSRSPGRIIRSYELTSSRPRAISRENPTLLDTREEILALLKPGPADEQARAA